MAPLAQARECPLPSKPENAHFPRKPENALSLHKPENAFPSRKLENALSPRMRADGISPRKLENALFPAQAQECSLSAQARESSLSPQSPKFSVRNLGVVTMGFAAAVGIEHTRILQTVHVVQVLEQRAKVVPKDQITQGWRRWEVVQKRSN